MSAGMRPLLLCAAAAALTACSSAGSSPAAAPAAGTATGSGSVTFSVKGYTFPALTVAPGAQVTVIDGDDEPHTVTAVDGSFDSGTFDAAHRATFTAPTEPGSYAITCQVHPSMHGTIVVR